MPDNIEMIKSDLADIRGSLSGITEHASRAKQDSESARKAAEKIRGKDISSAFDSQLGKISTVLNRSIQNSLNEFIFEGASLKSALNKFGSGFIQGLVSRSLNTDPFAKITPFAKGGVINRPTFFPLGGGGGIAGEAGAEAILPLSRSADGKLGVRSAGSNRPVIINIQTQNLSSFNQSQTQIASQLQRAVQRGSRNI